MHISAQDQIDQGAFGRSLKAGTYPAFVLSADLHTSAKGTGCIKLTLTVEPPDPLADEVAPEGKVKIDHYCVGGQASMKQFVALFFPTMVGKSFDPDLSGLPGRRIGITTRWRDPVRNEDGTQRYGARAEVVRLHGRLKGDTTPDLKIDPPSPAAADDLPF